MRFAAPFLLSMLLAGVLISATGCLPADSDKAAAVEASAEPAPEPFVPRRPEKQEADISAKDVVCRDNAAAEAPASDKPTPAEARTLKDCLSTDFYYGIDGKRDLIKARKCAFVEYEQGEEGGYPGPYGAGVLMMIYAKGEGVKTNFGFARRMACQAGYAEYDIIFKLDEIAARETDPKAPVDICYNISSSWLSGQCAATEGHRLDQERDHRIARLQRGWPASRLETWKSLDRRRAAYEDARIQGGEVDLRALLRTVYAVNVENEVRSQHEALLKRLIKGGSRPRESLAAADARLNDVYRQLMGDTSEFAWPEPDDLRSIQRTWLRYRDDWRAFAEANWPGQGDTVAALLTSARADALTCFAEDRPETLKCA